MTQWVRFRSTDPTVGARFGILTDGEIEEHVGDLFAAARPTGRRCAADSVELLSPCSPSKIVALWNNFHALAAKIGKQAPTHPLFFIKSGSSAIGTRQSIRRPPTYAGKIVFEGELGIVIGKTCRNVPCTEALDHIFGYTCVNDVTAMDILFETGDFPQWGRAKSFDTFGCLGPLIASDLDVANARVVTRLDGVERQNYPLADMVFSPAELVSMISADLTLEAGDVIACGTSVGAGSVKDGGAVEIFIEGIGSLVNTLAPSSG